MKIAKKGLKDNIIDMSVYETRIYMGREQGYLSREYYDLPSLEANCDKPIVVYFPDDTKSLLSSFFLGMFGNSIIASDSQEDFMKKYKFVAKNNILESIKEYIDCGLIAKRDNA
jgi:hypothetical protein